MKPKPTPKKELFVEMKGGQLIDITCHSDDAIAWLEKEAVNYGNLYASSSTRTWLLIVFPGYDPAQN